MTAEQTAARLDHLNVCIARVEERLRSRYLVAASAPLPVGTLHFKKLEGERRLWVVDGENVIALTSAAAAVRVAALAALGELVEALDNEQSVMDAAIERAIGVAEDWLEADEVRT